MNTSPWSALKTPQRQPFQLTFGPRKVRVGVPGLTPGTNVSYEADLAAFSDRVVCLTHQNGPHLEQVFHLELSAWKGPGVPDLQVHPIALVHLFKSGQLPPADVFKFRGRTNPARMQIARRLITSDCTLARQLRVKRFRLSLCTMFSVGVQVTE